MPQPASKYLFGPYEVRCRTRELYKFGTKLKLRPQAFLVLQILVERAPDVVIREELRQRLWSSKTFVDFEAGLNTAIKELRSILSDSATEPRYVETLPKLGYRMVALVEREEVKPEEAEEAIAVAAGEEISMPTATRTESNQAEPHSHPPPGLVGVVRPAIRSRWWGIAAAFALLLSAIGYWQWSRPQHRIQQSPGRIMLAVLPFENLTGDPSQDYFSDGLTEEMISQLGSIDPARMGVIARTSVMHYKHSQAPLNQIGSELNVNYILEGSVRRDANSVRISTQLIQLKDQTHVWARQYDRELSNLLALQGEIAQEAADEIQLTLGQKARPAAAPASASLSSQATEAYDLYLRGRYFWNKRTLEALDQAAESFQQAIAKDPSYAPAYAGLADAYALIPGDVRAKPQEFMPKARLAALKALQLDDKLAEAHTSLALVTENYNYDLQTAEREFRRAIELNPNYATAHHWYAECLMWQGRFDEALQESERARQLDPLSLIIASDHGVILYYMHQYDAAIAQFRAVLAIDPHFGRANVIYSAYLRKGMFSEALADSDKDIRHCVRDPWVCGWLAYVYGVAGQPAKARPALEELEKVDHSRHIRPEPLFAAHIALGQTDRAFQDLERAYSERSNTLVTLKVDQLYDPLRGDPRFQDLLRRVGLAQ